MFEPTRYLEWARRAYGQVRYDLATSGIPGASTADLGALDVAAFDDPSAWPRLRDAVAAYNDVPGEEAIAAPGNDIRQSDSRDRRRRPCDGGDKPACPNVLLETA